MALFTYGLPGAAYIFQGQELGLPDAELLDSDRQDPAFFRTKGVQKGRDGARVPLPWKGETSPFGFTTGKPWLPIPQDWATKTFEKQSGDSASSLEMYRELLTLRKGLNPTASDARAVDDFIWTQRPNGTGLIAYKRGGTEIILNTSESDIVLKRTGRIIFSSEISGMPTAFTARPDSSTVGEIVLSPLTAIWIVD